MVFKAVQVLVSLLAHVAFVRLFFLHSLSPGIWRLRVGINDGERAISILVQSLIVVSMLKLVSMLAM